MHRELERLAIAQVALLLAACGPLSDLDHRRESAVVTSMLSIGDVMIEADKQAWDADPSASCEISDEYGGEFRFAMAANEQDPVALAVRFDRDADGSVSGSLGLGAKGHSEWKPDERCALRLLSYDFHDRLFEFEVDCAFTNAQSNEAILVQGVVLADRCFDPTVISFQRVEDLASRIGDSIVDLGEALVDDPEGFGKSLLLLPLIAAGGH